jgi:hypothetical protein
MVAATGNLDDRAWKRWSSTFYSLLSNGFSLSRAFAIAQAIDDLSVAMILRRDTTFKRPPVDRKQSAQSASK